MAAATVSAVTLEELVGDEQRLPPLPQAMVELLKLTDNPSASARQIAAAIAIDMSFASRVLAVANSAYYGMSRAVRTVNDAVVVLGVHTVRHLALAAAASGHLRSPMPGYGLGAGDLWRHSTACAVTSRLIARTCGVARVDEVFVAGLLHDIGKVLLQRNAAEPLLAARALATRDNLPMFEAERMALGLDHAQAGAALADRWKLPDPLCAAIAGHHCLEHSAVPELTAIVHLANIISHDSSLQPRGTRDAAVFPEQAVAPAAVERLGLTEDALEPIKVQAASEVAQFAAFFD